MKKHITLKHRHCPPTKFDIEPYGTIYEVKTDTSIDYYVQMGDEEQDINWQPYCNLLTEVFGKFASNKEFIEALLNILKDPERSKSGLYELMNIALK